MTDVQMHALVISGVVCKLSAPVEAAEFEALCRVWHSKRGNDPLFSLRVGVWITKRIADEMPFYACPARDQLEAVFERLIKQERTSLTDEEVQSLAEISAGAKKDYTFGVWLALLGILESLCACRFDEALERHIEAVGKREVPLARDEVLRLFRPAA